MQPHPDTNANRDSLKRSFEVGRTPEGIRTRQFHIRKHDKGKKGTARLPEHARQNDDTDPMGRVRMDSHNRKRLNLMVSQPRRPPSLFVVTLASSTVDVVTGFKEDEV